MRAARWSGGQIAARRSTYKQLSKRSPLYKAKHKIEKAKAQVRAKVEHPFRVIKRQFGYTKMRFRGLASTTSGQDQVYIEQRRSIQANHLHARN